MKRADASDSYFNTPFSWIFRCHSDVAVEYFNDGGLIFCFADRRLIDINITGSQIIKLTDGRRTVHQVAELLVGLFDRTIPQIEQDVLDFYNYLQKIGLLDKVIPTEMQQAPNCKVLSRRTRYKRNPIIVIHENNEGAVLTNQDTHQVKLINSTGQFIWKLCDGRFTLGEIASKLDKAYDFSLGDQAVADTQDFLVDMQGIGFVITLFGD